VGLDAIAICDCCYDREICSKPWRRTSNSIKVAMAVKMKFMFLPKTNLRIALNVSSGFS